MTYTYEADDIETTDDALLGGRVRLRQPADGYRVAIDPVLLAAATPAGAGEHVLDLGSGAGAASLCLARRVAGCRITGIEIDPGLVGLANANGRTNGVAERVDFLAGDISAPPVELARGGYDHVIANPPHLSAAAADPSPHAGKTRANIEGDDADLRSWLSAMLAMVRRKGRLTLITRADRLDEVLGCLHGRAGDTVLFPLWPGRGRPAKRILIGARRGVNGPLRLAAGMVLHGADGRFTQAAEAILRHGAALDLWTAGPTPNL